MTIYQWRMYKFGDTAFEKDFDSYVYWVLKTNLVLEQVNSE